MYTDLNGCGSTVGNEADSQKWMTSGLVEFNSTVRQWGIPAQQYINESGLNQCPAQQALPAWSSPWTNSSLYLMGDWGNNNGQFGGVPVIEGHQRSGSVTVQTTTAVTGMASVDISLDISLPGTGVGFGVPVASLSWSQTGSTSQINTLEWTAYNTVSSVYPMCFVAYGTGGSESGNTADFIGLWEYLPQDSGGSYSCPLPQDVTTPA